MEYLRAGPVVLVLTAGCSIEFDGPLLFREDDPLRDGTFTRVESEFEPATCMLLWPLAGRVDRLEITDTSTSVSIISDDGLLDDRHYERDTDQLRADDCLGGPYLDDFRELSIAHAWDLTATYDCTLDLEFECTGIVVSRREFMLHDRLSIRRVDGTECPFVIASAGIATLPCEDVEGTRWHL